MQTYEFKGIATVRTSRQDVSENIDLDFVIKNEGGEDEWTWVLKGYGKDGELCGDLYATPELARKAAEDYGNAWVYMREVNMRDELCAKGAVCE